MKMVNKNLAISAKIKRTNPQKIKRCYVPATGSRKSLVCANAIFQTRCNLVPTSPDLSSFFLATLRYLIRLFTLYAKNPKTAKKTMIKMMFFNSIKSDYKL